MATLEKRGDSYRVIFYLRGRRFARSLRTDDKKKAGQLLARLEGNIELLEHGRLEYDPERDDLATVLLTDGRLTSRPEPARRTTLGEFFDRYATEAPPDKEANTKATESIHIRHLRRLIGDRTPLSDVPTHLQPYVNARHKEGVTCTTVKKELGTLSAIWNRWGTGQKLVAEPLSLRSLGYPKRTEKPPFRTWDQITKKTADPRSPLWASVYLSVGEVEQLLAAVPEECRPLFSFVAYTGCRRSEMMRARVEDVDFTAGEVTIREKKKDRSKDETSRRVPLVPALAAALQQYLSAHPGGRLFSQAGQPLTPPLSYHLFRRAVAGTRWEVLRGFHVLRHSLISNLAAHGVSEQVIMGIVGHLNPETTRRYLHLRPQTLSAAMSAVWDHRP